MILDDAHADQRPLIVAEIGNNHEGNVEVAKELVRKAADCGVRAVKFQTFRTKYFISASQRARYERLTAFELSYRDFEQLHRLTKSLGLLFLSTPLDLESAKFLSALVDGFKIASGDNTFYPLISAVCETGKPIVLSSGLSDLQRIVESKQFIDAEWSRLGIEQTVSVLHCVSSYPAPDEEINLAVIPRLADALGCPVGYSDHTIGIEACVIATVLGARIIEKHFTLDKNYSAFRDHQLSADPNDMKRLVQQVTRVRVLLGKPEKAIQASEALAVAELRRSIVAAGNLPQGHRLRWEDLTWIRPAAGLPPGHETRVLDRTLKRSVSFGEPILPEDVT